jgi:hypothetical protein
VTRGAAAVVLAAVLLAACSRTPAASPSAGASDPAAVTLTYTVPTPAGPPQPWRGQITQYVHLAFGQATMYFELKNVGEQPVTFLNTLYDYEPTQLWEPVVRLEWDEGGNAVYTRAGRFFPSPAIVEVGTTAVYLMGSQPLTGSGTPGALTAHIKDCPTRGMDDVPAALLEVSDLTWQPGAAGEVTVSGTVANGNTAERNQPPTIGIAFFDDAGTFVGAVVASNFDSPLAPGESRAFQVSGGGVSTADIATARAWAFVP